MSESDWDDLKDLGIDVEVNTYDAYLLKPKNGDITSFRIDTTLIDHGYFLFRAKKLGRQYEPITWDADTVDGKYKWTVTPDPALGFPGTVEKKVLRGLEMLVTQYLENFGECPGFLPFKIKSLTDLALEHEVGGKDVKDVRTALERLSKTRITRIDEEGKKEEFRVIEEIIYPEKRSSVAEDIEAYHLVVFNHYFMTSMEKSEMTHDIEEYRRYATIMPLMLQMYEKIRLDFMRSGEDGLCYDYEELCSLLGVVPKKNFSEASKPFMQILMDLKSRKMIRDWHMSSDTFEIFVRKII